MSDDTIGGGFNKYSSPDQGNISVSKTMHTHTVEKSTEDVILDQIDEASTVNYQEEYIPPASSPTLSPADSQVSDQKPNTSPTPQTQYTQNVQTALYNLPSSLLASLGNGNSLAGLNKLIYAFNHPQANVDPQVANTISQIKGQVLTQTQTALGLGSSWTPALPNTDAADKQLSSDYNNVFESLVNNSDLSNEDVNRLLFYHYHPEEMPSNDPLAQNLAEFENAAYQSVAESEGLPANGKIPLDSAQYDAQVSQSYDDAFNKHVDQDPETQNLSEQEKAELETLHQFPDADVPDKANLEGLMTKLEDEALSDTQQQFNLPDKYKPEANFKDFSALVLGNYKAQFDSNVQNSAPFTLTAQQAQQFQLQSDGQPVTINLTSDQRMLLMQTNGISPKNLPPDLVPIFYALQAQTAGDIAQSLGLPEDWLSATQNESPEDDSVVEKALSEAGGNPEDQTNVDGSLNNVGINAFAKILGKLLNTQKLADVEFSGSSQSLDYSLALNAINLAQDAVSAIKMRSTQFDALATDGFITAQNGWLNAGDYTALIASCLDKLRQTVYQMQSAQSNEAQKVNIMSLEVAKAKQFISEQQRLAQQQSEANQPHQKDWAANLINAADATGNPWLIGLTHMFVDTVKVVAWILDTATGGLISTICQAAGLTDLSENPLEMMGVLTPDQAAKMNLGLQIIGMIAQMAVEILTADPAALAGSIMNFAKDVAEIGVTEAVSKVASSAMTAVSDAVSGALNAVKGAAEAFASDPVGFFMDIVKSAGNAIVDNIFEPLSAAGGWIKQTATGIMEGSINILEESVRCLENLVKAIKDAFEEAEDVDALSPKERLEAALKKVNMGLRIKDVLVDTLNGIAGGIVALKNAQTETEQAALKRIIGALDAALTELEADAKVINKVSQTILDQLNSLVGWVSDINRQESDMFKKLPIHFISA